LLSLLYLFFSQKSSEVSSKVENIMLA